MCKNIGALLYFWHIKIMPINIAGCVRCAKNNKHTRKKWKQINKEWAKNTQKRERNIDGTSIMEQNPMEMM